MVYKQLENNVLMFHRVEFLDALIPKIYHDRGMVHKIEEICDILDNYLSQGYKITSLEDAISNVNCIHLTFDDGYREHLRVALFLHEKYNISYEGITFLINVGNSFLNKNICMDFLYSLNHEQKIKCYGLLGIPDENINELKKRIFSSTPDEIEILFNKITTKKVKVFLNEQEVYQLSSIFTIGSHSINHVFLTENMNIAQDELSYSKELLEKTVSQNVHTFCYPEGKSNTYIENLCQKAGYTYGLSIKGKSNNKYAIPRITKR